MPNDDDTVLDIGAYRAIIAEIIKCKTDEAMIAERRKSCEDALKTVLDNAGATVGQIDGCDAVTNREFTRTAFDLKAFRADVGEAVADKYTKTSIARRFNVKG